MPNAADIPLALYVHLPWCVKKCPYCDFNSHTAPDGLPENAYVEALIRDLDRDLPLAGGRELISIFIGGGTPSLFAAESIARLLDGVRDRLPLAPACEVTLEANPGAIERGRFDGFRQAGVNRISLGVQSLDNDKLRRLGRIHSADEARTAVAAARAAGFDDVNLDLMYALPHQTPAEAAADLDALLAIDPPHLSYYQLTLEPGTAFHHRPPPLPTDEAAWHMHESAQQRLATTGLAQYEVSAWARPGHESVHNGNYWRFGDYLGIGAGAHGKLSDPVTGTVQRLTKQRWPNRYMATAGSSEATIEMTQPSSADLEFEFLLNALRLTDGFDRDLYESRTGLAWASLRRRLARAIESGLLTCGNERLRCTELGRRHLDGLLVELLPDAA